MVDLKKEVQFIKGVGPSRAKLLQKLDINTLEDLILFFPREHEDRSKPKSISELIDGEEVLISGFPVGRVNEIRIRKNLVIYKLFIRDETGTCEMNWYNQSYLKNTFSQEKRYSFFGKISIKYGKASMQSPVYELEGANKNTGKIVPIYPLTYSLSQNVLRKIMENGINEVDGKLEETLPKYLLDTYNLCDINSAIHQIHFPNSFEDFNKARRRLVFEELFTMQLALLKLKNKFDVEKNRN